MNKLTSRILVGTGLFLVLAGLIGIWLGLESLEIFLGSGLAALTVWLVLAICDRLPMYIAVRVIDIAGFSLAGLGALLIIALMVLAVAHVQFSAGARVFAVFMPMLVFSGVSLLSGSSDYYLYRTIDKVLQQYDKPNGRNNGRYSQAHF